MPPRSKAKAAPAAGSLETMALKDLLDLELRVKKAIAHAKDRERLEVKQKIEAMVSGSGFSVGELFGTRSATKGKTVAAKFVNPENKSETWTGRGRKPRWLVAKLNKGAKMQDFAI